MNRLTKAESFLNKILPPDFEVNEVDTSEMDAVGAQERVAVIGYQLPNRVKRLAQLKIDQWKQLNLRSDQQLEVSILIYGDSNAHIVVVLIHCGFDSIRNRIRRL